MTMARTSSGGDARNDAPAAKQKKPKKRRWYHQLWDVYQMTRKQNPLVTWWMLTAFAVLAAMFILSRSAEKAAYTQIAGQPGAARAALGTVRGGWTFEDEPVAVDARNQDFVFRGVGRAGVVLVSEGPAHRVGRLLEQ